MSKVSTFNTMKKGSKAMYIEGVESGVCGFYVTLYTD